MIRYFTSRELSQRLSINLARWKRWSREFLPPDPLGGLQSGYARQYSINDAFKVFLGGYLVAELKYSIPEAKIIIADVTDWGEQAGLFINATSQKAYRHPLFRDVVEWALLICPRPRSKNEPSGFIYKLRGLIEEKTIVSEGRTIKEFRYYETRINNTETNETVEFNDPLRTKTLSIKALLTQFVACLELDRKDFPILAAGRAAKAVEIESEHEQ